MDYSLLGGHIYDNILQIGIEETIKLSPLFEEAILIYEKILKTSVVSKDCLETLTEEKIKLLASPFLECVYLFINKRTVDGFVCANMLVFIARKCERFILFLYSKKLIDEREVLDAACRVNSVVLFEFGLRLGIEVYKSNYILELCCRLENAFFVSIILARRREYAYNFFMKSTFNVEVINTAIVKYMKLQTPFEIALKKNNRGIIDCFLAYDSTLNIFAKINTK